MITIPDYGVLRQLKELEEQERAAREAEEARKNQPEEGQKRKPGRPKGSKDKVKRKPYGKPNNPFTKEDITLIDPKTGIVVNNNANGKIIKNMGDERVSAFVVYHMEMMRMREGCNKKDVPDLYNRFYNYLAYCAEHGIIPNNMNAYYAIGIDKSDIVRWKAGGGTKEQAEFAMNIAGFFASVHEQAPTAGLMNPISAIFWQKSHDGFIEAQKVEVVNKDPLGEQESADNIMKKYEDVSLPD